jgi:hypothetical protein
MLHILLIFSIIEHAVAREPIHHARRDPLPRLLLLQPLYHILSQVVHSELFKQVLIIPEQSVNAIFCNSLIEC